jgi:hypothetical protein
MDKNKILFHPCVTVEYTLSVIKIGRFRDAWFRAFAVINKKYKVPNF